MNSYEHSVLLHYVFCATDCVYTKSLIFLRDYSKGASSIMK